MIEIQERRWYELTGSFERKEAMFLLGKNMCRLLRAMEKWRGWRDRRSSDDVFAACFGFPNAWAFRWSLEWLVREGYIEERGLPQDRRLRVSDVGQVFSDDLGGESVKRDQWGA